jgi:hypothetical protein
MSTVMQNWKVMKEDDGVFHVCHYVGGEEGDYIFDTFTMECTAKHFVKFLNETKILSYAWIDHGEGDFSINVFETNLE